MPRSRPSWRLVVTLVAIAFALLLANAWRASRETRPARADVGRVVHVAGADLQVTDTGARNDRALVLLHGWTESLRVWDTVLPGLGRGLRIVRVDLPGHGGSEARRDGYTIPDQARQVARVLDALGVRDAVVAGHSMGGDVAVQLAAARSDLVHRIVLLDAPTAPGFLHPSLMVKSSLVPLAGPVGHELLPDRIEREALKIAVAPGAQVPEQMVKDLNRVPWPAYKQAFDDTGDWVRERSVPDRLRQLDIATVVVWGSRDQLVDPAALERYRGLPRTRTVVLAGVGHTPPVEAPRATARLLRSFALAP